MDDYDFVGAFHEVGKEQDALLKQMWAVIDDLVRKGEFKKLVALNHHLASQIHAGASNGRAYEAARQEKKGALTGQDAFDFIVWQRHTNAFPVEADWMLKDEVMAPLLKQAGPMARAVAGDWPETAGNA